MKFVDLLSEDITEDQRDTYKRWRSLINMTAKEIQEFYDSDDGKDAGLKRDETDGIKRGRDSAKAIIRMLERPVEKWTPNDWEWAGRQISFISRMSGAKGPLRDENNKPTRKLLALKIWGNDPEKNN